MQVKRFVAANMRSALKMVREEMGPDAVILSNKRVVEGVELLISLEQPAVDSAPAAALASKSSANPFQQAAQDSWQAAAPTTAPSKLSRELDRADQQARQRAQTLTAMLGNNEPQSLEQALQPTESDATELDLAIASAGKPEVTVSLQSQQDKSPAYQVVNPPATNDVVASAPSPTVDLKPSAIPSVATEQQELSDMRFELQSMRDLLEQQFKSMAWASFSQQNPLQASFWKRMKRMGMGASVVQPLLSKYPLNSTGAKQNSTECWQQIMADLCSQLPVMEEDLIEKGGVFAFVGPTGAGKTTTIGKLAARYVLKHGADNIALVTTDTLRIAAHEQLRTVGRILNVPVNIVDKHNSLERVLYSLRHKSLVLIDTAGLNRQDERLGKQLESLNEAGGRLRTLLVIPTTSQVAVIKSAFYSYKTDNLCGCVLTKLDESASLGEVITLAIDKSLPIAYTTDGQGIPDDIAVASRSSLVRSAIGLAKGVATDEQLMAEEFGSSTH